MTNPFAAFDADPTFDAPEAHEAHDHQDMRGRLATAADAVQFMTAGRATVTLVSKKTSQRFTYRLGATEDKSTIFVSVLTGSDNESDYSYLGRIASGPSGRIFWAGRKVPRPGDVGRDAPSSKAFAWTWQNLVRGTLPEQLEVWHEGRCGRCGRKLTVPQSVAQGFGPECVQHVHS